MNWGGFDAFLEMGGHGFFVWSSFGVVLLVLALEWILLKAQGHAVARALRQRWGALQDEAPSVLIQVDGGPQP